MKTFQEMSEAEKIIFRISEISALALKLAAIGYKNGLHCRIPLAEKEKKALLEKESGQTSGQNSETNCKNDSPSSKKVMSNPKPDPVGLSNKNGKTH